MRLAVLVKAPKRVETMAWKTIVDDWAPLIEVNENGPVLRYISGEHMQHKFYKKYNHKQWLIGIGVLPQTRLRQCESANRQRSSAVLLHHHGLSIDWARPLTNKGLGVLYVGFKAVKCRCWTIAVLHISHFILITVCSFTESLEQLVHQINLLPRSFPNVICYKTRFSLF